VKLEILHELTVYWLIG